MKDFAPITVLAFVPNIVVVHPSVQAKNIQELIALTKTKPGGVTYGSAGSGTSHHMAAELFKSMAKVDMQHVPYKGGGPMLIDLIGGQIQLGFDNLPSAIAHVRSGKVRALAVTTAKRWPGAPAIPTLAESGGPLRGVGLVRARARGDAEAGRRAAASHTAAILRTPRSRAVLRAMRSRAATHPRSSPGRSPASCKWAKVVAATVKLGAHRDGDPDEKAYLLAGLLLAAAGASKPSQLYRSSR